MSGGEQQMLAVGRGLMLKPRLLMLDEPSLGLAPVMTDVTFEKIGEIHKMGTAILLVEQNVSRALSLVQRAYVLESGKVIMRGTSAELANNRRCRPRIWGSRILKLLTWSGLPTFATISTRSGLMAGHDHAAWFAGLLLKTLINQ
jgi:ABC-type lipopolysaccharide export system ATPase subunit